MKARASLHRSTFFCCGEVLLQRLRTVDLLGNPDSWCFMQNTSEGPVVSQAEPAVWEPEFMLYGFEFVILLAVCMCTTPPGSALIDRCLLNIRIVVLVPICC